MTWEYDSFADLVSEPDKFLANLKLCGADGWELVSTQIIGNHIFGFLKRPLLFSSVA
jgi:hypothetical protein